MFDLNLPRKRQDGSNIIQIIVLLSFTAVIFITVLYLWMAVQNEYNTARLIQQLQTKEQKVNPYLNDPLYCQTIDDCAIQTSCAVCSCGQAVNKYNLQTMACPAIDESMPQPLCDACPQTELKCINNQCQLSHVVIDYNTNDLVVITSPQHNDIIGSPLAISGSAKGVWYFEGSFPIKIYDADENLLALGIATAQDDWMVDDFVDFKATLEFEMPLADFGWLVLEKDNPSGLAENDDELRILVRFR